MAFFGYKQAPYMAVCAAIDAVNESVTLFDGGDARADGHSSTCWAGQDIDSHSFEVCSIGVFEH